MRLPKRGEKGFTLIELLIVVAILGVLAAVVIPNVGRFLGRGEDEARRTEFHNVSSAVIAMMTDNEITAIPNPIILGANATNDMAAFDFDESVEPPSLSEVKEARQCSALAGDEIYADPSSIIGSIGVIFAGVFALGVALMSTIQTAEPDRVLFMPMRKSIGFFNGGKMMGVNTVTGPRESAFGHSGAGGSTAFADPEVGLSTPIGQNSLQNELGKGRSKQPERECHRAHADQQRAQSGRPAHQQRALRRRVRRRRGEDLHGLTRNGLVRPMCHTLSLGAVLAGSEAAPMGDFYS